MEITTVFKVGLALVLAIVPACIWGYIFYKKQTIGMDFAVKVLNSYRGSKLSCYMDINPKKIEGAMDSYQADNRNGLECLLDRFRTAFRIPKNLNYYSIKDFQAAGKKDIKYCINYGFCGVTLNTNQSRRVGR